MSRRQLRFSRHALERMFERQITPEVVEQIIGDGQVIAEYPDDKPYPSRLMLGFDDERPVHVVYAEDIESMTGYIVTAYIPNANLWNDDFQTRRP